MGDRTRWSLWGRQAGHGPWLPEAQTLLLTLELSLVGSQAGLLSQPLLCPPGPLFGDLLRTVTATVPI